jgi:hypothetical protein
MKYLKFGIILVALAFVAALFTFKWKKGEAEAQQDIQAEQSVEPIPVTFSVEAKPSVPLVQRIGVNLSFWSTWGAEQYALNNTCAIY